MGSLNLYPICLLDPLVMLHPKKKHPLETRNSYNKTKGEKAMSELTESEPERFLGRPRKELVNPEKGEQ